MLVSHLKCIHSILVHKWSVIVIGRKLKVSWWNLLIHDLSRFLPSEFPHVAKKYFGANDDEEGFNSYHALHVKRNRHHPEFWVNKNGNPSPMPIGIVKEMLADWSSATKSHSKIEVDYDNWEWFNRAFPRMRLHPITRKRVLLVLNELKTLDK